MGTTHQISTMKMKMYRSHTAQLRVFERRLARA